jgi:hypothetical protein
MKQHCDCCDQIRTCYLDRDPATCNRVGMLCNECTKAVGFLRQPGAMEYLRKIQHRRHKPVCERHRRSREIVIEMKNMFIVPTPGRSFAEDMQDRDEAAICLTKLMAAGMTPAVIVLHANLGNREIPRVIYRYAGIPVRFVLAEHDSTPAQRRAFRHLWKSNGGPEIEESLPEEIVNTL